MKHSDFYCTLPGVVGSSLYESSILSFNNQKISFWSSLTILRGELRCYDKNRKVKESSLNDTCIVEGWVQVCQRTL